MKTKKPQLIAAFLLLQFGYLVPMLKHNDIDKGINQSLLASSRRR